MPRRKTQPSEGDELGANDEQIFLSARRRRAARYCEGGDREWSDEEVLRLFRFALEDLNHGCELQRVVCRRLKAEIERRRARSSEDDDFARIAGGM